MRSPTLQVYCNICFSCNFALVLNAAAYHAALSVASRSFLLFPFLFPFPSSFYFSFTFSFFLVFVHLFIHLKASLTTMASVKAVRFAPRADIELLIINISVGTASIAGESSASSGDVNRRMLHSKQSTLGPEADLVVIRGRSFSLVSTHGLILTQICALAWTTL